MSNTDPTTDELTLEQAITEIESIKLPNSKHGGTYGSIEMNRMTYQGVFMGWEVVALLLFANMDMNFAPPAPPRVLASGVGPTLLEAAGKFLVEYHKRNPHD